MVTGVTTTPPGDTQSRSELSLEFVPSNVALGSAADASSRLTTMCVSIGVSRMRPAFPGVWLSALLATQMIIALSNSQASEVSHAGSACFDLRRSVMHTEGRLSKSESSAMSPRSLCCHDGEFAALASWCCGPPAAARSIAAGRSPWTSNSWHEEGCAWRAPRCGPLFSSIGGSSALTD